MTTCGPYLDTCTCRRRGGTPRTWAEIDADHRAAVDRAIRSGWADEPIPQRVLHAHPWLAARGYTALRTRGRVA